MKTNTFILLSTLVLATGLSADSPEEHARAISEKTVAPVTIGKSNQAATTSTLDSFVRVNATIQTFNAGQPWQRNGPQRRSGLGTLISASEILTTAEMVANQTYLELENADSTQRVQAQVIAIDYKANLALLSPIKEAPFLKRKTPLQLGTPARIGDLIDIWQFENNGTTLKTVATIRAVDTSSTFIPGYSFLIYTLKGSMQSASSSFTLPATRDGKLIGVLTSYDSEDQISEVIAPEIVSTFLKDARDGNYEGFPTLGCATRRTEDEAFREYLQLSPRGGGLYVSRVRPGSPAAKADLRVGDVLLAIDRSNLDRRGFFEHPSYGPLPWTVLIRSDKMVGDSVTLRVLREGQLMELPITLEAPQAPLVPTHINDSPPPFLIKGGFVFQELSRSYLRAYGDKWATRAPLSLMYAMDNPDKYEEDRDSIVFLSRVLPNPVTIGYDSLNGIIINQVNGKSVRNITELANFLKEAPENGIHTIELDDTPGTVYLDATLSDQVDQQLLQRGLPALSRLPAEEPLPQQAATNNE